jgi:hypothetical protein
MMAKAPDSFDPAEVDEPTQRFLRTAAPITAVADGTVRFSVVTTSHNGPDEVDGDWFEVAGRRIRVSLDSLAHIGLSGEPPGMITSGRLRFVAGEIPRDRDAPLSRAEPYAPVGRFADESFGYEHPGRRRGLLLLGATLALAFLLGLWALSSSDVPVNDEHVAEHDGAAEEPTLVPPAEKTRAAPLDPPHPAPEASPYPAEPSTKPGKTGKQATKAATAACAARRRNAEAALREGEWAQLEVLVKQTKCWRKPSEAKALLMRALFELERFEECIELSKNDRSKEVGKWQKNCSRALQ